jgi:hypothetical protein
MLHFTFSKKEYDAITYTLHLLAKSFDALPLYISFDEKMFAQCLKFIPLFVIFLSRSSFLDMRPFEKKKW